MEVPGMKTLTKQNKHHRGIDAKGNSPKVRLFDIKKPSVFVSQDFKVLDDRILDSKGRITISQNWISSHSQPVRSFKIFRNGDGDLLLRPEISIPAREAWVFKNPEVFASIQRGIQEAKEGKGEVIDDIDDFIKKL